MVGPKGFDPGLQGATQSFDGRIDLVANEVLHVIPELFKRVELRAVGRQREESDILRHPLCLIFR